MSIIKQINGRVRPWTPKDVTLEGYDKAIVRLLLLSNSDPSSTRFGMLSCEEVGVLERVCGVQK